MGFHQSEYWYCQYMKSAFNLFILALEWQLHWQLHKYCLLYCTCVLPRANFQHQFFALNVTYIFKNSSQRDRKTFINKNIKAETYMGKCKHLTIICIQIGENSCGYKNIYKATINNNRQCFVFPVRPVLPAVIHTGSTGVYNNTDVCVPPLLNQLGPPDSSNKPALLHPAKAIS